MEANDSLYFVEVKYRKSNFFNQAEFSVSKSKQLKIKKTAALFLAKNPSYQEKFGQFDVLVVSGDLKNPKIIRIDSAFD